MNAVWAAFPLVLVVRDFDDLEKRWSAYDRVETALKFTHIIKG